MNTSTVIEASTGASSARSASSRSAETGLAFHAVAWFGRIDAEGLLEAPPSQPGDDDGVAPPHPFPPAEIEVALRERGPQRSRDVWAWLGPIGPAAARMPAGRTWWGKLDPDRGEEAPAGRGDDGGC